MFDRAVGFVIRWEAFGGEPETDGVPGATRLEGDPGGLTSRYGISQRAHPDVDVEHLTRDGAVAIFWRDYWVPARCDRFPAPLALALLDASVMHGVPRAVSMLQRALGVAADGIPGPETVTAAWRAPLRRTLITFLGHRGVLFDKDPQDWLGWYRRLCDCAIEAMAG